jgi:hypothetical protein
MTRLAAFAAAAFVLHQLPAFFGRVGTWIDLVTPLVVVGVAAWALAGGLLFGQTWLLVFGAVFLAEELYETGVVALILRAAARA